MQHLFDMRPDRPGFRLHRLELFNWGTFDSSDGRVHRFEPQGRTSLLVGHNGTGKSTLVDAILTLLVDSRSRNYNLAAGAKKSERSPVTYIKGAYDKTSDEAQSSVVRYLRPEGNHLTAISAVFRDEQLAKSFTIMQVLHLNSENGDDKVYAIADEEHELELDLSGLTRSDEVRDHLKKRGYHTTKTYADYHAWITKRTGMRAKAVDMFNQTVHVKDIQSLNAFIRKHMLEAHDWQEKIQRLLTHFNDLSVAHQELVNARRAVELLLPVEEAGAKYRQAAEEMESLERQQTAAESYFPFVTVTLLEPAIAQKRAEETELSATIERIDLALEEIRSRAVDLEIAINEAAGERLKKIPGLIDQAATHVRYKKPAFTQFTRNIEACGIEWSEDSKAGFPEIREQLQRISETARTQISELKGSHEDMIGAKSASEKLLRDEQSELLVLQQRRTNLPAKHSAMRSQICSDLQLEESILPFAAELIAVAPEHRDWEASAEMVLRPFALSLLVPVRFYRRVRSYVERNRMADAQGVGQRLDYICVVMADPSSGDRSNPKSLSLKLQIRPKHELSPWVRGEIAKRFDFHCCDTDDEFSELERMAMTRNRHVKFNSERHQKDDRASSADPRHFVLGWDNTEKKRRITERIIVLEKEIREQSRDISECSDRMRKLETIVSAAAAALAVPDFDTIDFIRHENEIAALEAEKCDLEKENPVVNSLRERLKHAKEDETRLGGQRDNVLEGRSRLQEKIKTETTLLSTARDALNATRVSGRFELDEPDFPAIAASLADPPLSAANVISRSRQWQDAIRVRIGNLKQPLENLAEKLRARMGAFLKAFREDSTELDATVKALASFMGRLEQLRREDLPRHEKKFKDRLNDQVSHEIAMFNTELREERRHIEQKISQLNEALAKVEYNRGTLMRLAPRSAQDGEIDEFRRSLRECLDESLEHTDAANEARFVRIKGLVERLADKDRSAWRNKVVDVRNWYDFAAQEIERESGSIRSCYDGGSGQSGGEKAKLAFTILVAALAYQFDIDLTGDTPGRFQFVVVDEMFSKIDVPNAKYALKLFKQFGLQLLIVSPLTANARVTEPYVDRYLHTVKNPETNHSQLYSMTAQEYEHVVRQFAANGAATAKPRISAK